MRAPANVNKKKDEKKPNATLTTYSLTPTHDTAIKEEDVKEEKPEP